MPNSTADALQGPEWDQVERAFAPSSKEGALGRVEDYDVVERRGRGGMGLVWRVLDDQVKNFALKVLRPSLNSDEVARLRFKHGGSVAFTLSDERLVKVWNLGE